MTARQHDIPLPQVLETTNALVNALSENQRAGVGTTLRSIIVRAYRKSKTEAALSSADEFGNSYGLNCLTGEDRRFPAITWDQQTIDSFGEWAEVLVTADKQLRNALDSEKQSATVLDAITTRITRAWRRPIAFKGGLTVYLRMSLASNGELVDVRIVKTSGDVLFDRSALTAVNRAAPFDEVKQFDEATFEEKFRSLTVKFRPED
jgi:colicin import membrane protein